MLPLGGAVTFSTPLPAGIGQADQPLIHVERVRWRAGADQHDRGDGGGIRRLHLECAAVADRAPG